MSRLAARHAGVAASMTLVALLLVPVVFGPAASLAATRPGPSRGDIGTGPDSLQLLSQTTWVGPGQSAFQMRLRVTASSQADEKLEVFVYGVLTARSQFQAALGGYVSNLLYQKPPVPLSELTADPAGGVDVDVAVNDLPITVTGVYPVQAFLEMDTGVRAGAPLTTFLVYAGKDASHLQRLNVATVVPLQANVPISLSGATGVLPGPVGRSLRADSAEVARWPVPVTLAEDVSTLEALAKGPGGNLAVARLSAAVASGDEVLPTTELPLDIPALVRSGLVGDVESELAAGGGALSTLLGEAPSLSTWAFAGGTDVPTVAALASLGARRVVVPASDLSALPASFSNLTFAMPTELSVPGSKVDVVGADAELSSRITQAAAPGQAVLVANQVLAELAMIDLEAPGDVRGVVLLPAPGTTVNPMFLSVFLPGLDRNPLLKASTLDQLFDLVPLAPGPGKPTLVRQLQGPRLSPPLAGAGLLLGARGAVSAAGEVYGAGSTLVRGFEDQLSVCLSSAFTGSQRAAMIGGVLHSAEVALSKVRLPPPVSITLTSRQGRLPLTLLSSAGAPVRVRLALTSEELSFTAAPFPEGRCRPNGAGSENCQLTLSHATTTLQIPVVVRTSGAFQLFLEIETPDGSRQMAAGTDSVRSTAISGVGLALMIGAALFLAAWWARNARHGRRAKRLVPRPPDDEDVQLEPDEPDEPAGLVPGRGDTTLPGTPLPPLGAPTARPARAGASPAPGGPLGPAGDRPRAGNPGPLVGRRGRPPA